MHRYEIGARLLCFEPDTSKAKLIYFAKILRHVSNSKSNEPHYGVHFHGWKCKWDREVPEHLLLENTEFNRMLKRKIDEIARHERNRYKRKERIDLVLQNASLCGDDVDWDSIPGVWKSVVKTKSHNPTTEYISSQEEVQFAEKPCFSFDDLELNLKDTEECIQFEFENLQAHELFHISFPLTSSLESFMHAHAIAGPAELSAVNFGWSSLVQVLQAYLDGFPYQNLNVPNGHPKAKCTGAKAFERLTRRLGPAYAKSDRSRLICAEVCSSLRVLFDCMADDYLLLPHEKATIPKYPFCEGRFLESGRAFLIPANAISVLKSDDSEGNTLTRYELLPFAYACRTPDLPCLIYPAHLLLRLFDNLPDILKSMQMSSCRRSIISRHLYLLTQYLEVTRSFWFSKERPDCIGQLLPSKEIANIKQSELLAKSGIMAHKQDGRKNDRGAISETSSSADTEPLMFGQGVKPVRRIRRVSTAGNCICAEKSPRPSERVQSHRFSLRSHEDQNRKVSEFEAANVGQAVLTQQPDQQQPTSSFLRSRRRVQRKSLKRENLPNLAMSSDQEDKLNTPPKTRVSSRLPSTQRSNVTIGKEEEDSGKRLTVPMTRFRASLFNSTGGRIQLRSRRAL